MADLAKQRPSFNGIEKGIDGEKTNGLWTRLQNAAPLEAFRLRRILCGGIEPVHRNAPLMAKSSTTSRKRQRKGEERQKVRKITQHIGSGSEDSSDDYSTDAGSQGSGMGECRASAGKEETESAEEGKKAVQRSDCHPQNVQFAGTKQETRTYTTYYGSARKQRRNTKSQRGKKYSRNGPTV